MERGWLGEKRGQGFYKRVGKEKEIHALDWKTLEYHPAQKASFPAVEAARNIEDLPERLRTLVAANDRAGTFLWNAVQRSLPLLRRRWSRRSPTASSRSIAPCAGATPTSSGPFELWDALGVQETVEAHQAGRPRDSRRTSSACSASGAKSLLPHRRSRRRSPQPATSISTPRSIASSSRGPASWCSRDIKRARGVVKQNRRRIADRSRRRRALRGVPQQDELARRGHCRDAARRASTRPTKQFRGHGDRQPGRNFSVGANLMLVLLAAQEGEWDELDAAVHRFQQANMAIKYAPKPVVAAPFGMTLGGGCEIALHAARVQASAETYMGLVEVGVGLIPAGGGCKEMLLRLGDARKRFRADRLRQGLDQRRRRARTGLAAPARRDLDESGAADRRCQSAGACRWRPTYAPGVPRQRYQGRGRSRLRAAEDGHLVLARQGGLHLAITTSSSARSWRTS